MEAPSNTPSADPANQLEALKSMSKVVADTGAQSDGRFARTADQAPCGMTKLLTLHTFASRPRTALFRPVSPVYGF